MQRKAEMLERGGGNFECGIKGRAETGQCFKKWGTILLDWKSSKAKILTQRDEMGEN